MLRGWHTTTTGGEHMSPLQPETTKVNLDALLLHQYETTELQAASKRFGAELERRKGAEKIRAKLIKMAKEAGLEISIKGGDSAFAGEHVKYRNPDNPSETWAGTGRKPKWLTEAEAKGKKLEDFEVKSEAKPESPQKHEAPLPLKNDTHDPKPHAYAKV
jgi:DNA-binding protein H-NS